MTGVQTCALPISAELARLGAGPITVVSPVSESGSVTLQAGDDYRAEDGRAVRFAVSDEEHKLELDDKDAVVRFKTTQATWTASDVEQTPDGYTVSFEPTRIQTAALTITRAPFELELTQADGDVITLARGTLTVVRDIPPIA